MSASAITYGLVRIYYLKDKVSRPTFQKHNEKKKHASMQVLQQVKFRKLISLIDGVKKDKCTVLHYYGSKDLFILQSTKDMKDVLIILEFKLKFYTLSGRVVRCYSAGM